MRESNEQSSPEALEASRQWWGGVVEWSLIVLASGLSLAGWLSLWCR